MIYTERNVMSMSKYGTPKLDRANFDKALHEWLYDYFGEDIYYETETFDEVINYNLGIPTSLLESEYRDTDEIRVGGENIERDVPDIQSKWQCSSHYGWQ